MAQGIGQLAHIVLAVNIKGEVFLAFGHAKGVAGDLAHRRADTQPQNHRQGKLHHKQATGHQNGLVHCFVLKLLQVAHGHAHKPHADDLVISVFDRPVSRVVVNPKNGVVGVVNLSLFQHGVDNFRRLQLCAHSPLPVIHDRGHHPGIALENGDVNSRKLLEPVKIGRGDQRGADGNGPHYPPLINHRLTGPDCERHNGACHNSRCGLPLEGNNHGFLIGHTVAVFIGVTTGDDLAGLISNGHEVRPGHFHAFFAQLSGQRMILVRNGLYHAAVAGNKGGALRKALAGDLVGLQNDILHAADALIQLIFNGDLHKIDGNKQHYPTAGNQSAE